VTNGINY